MFVYGKKKGKNNFLYFPQKPLLYCTYHKRYDLFSLFNVKEKGSVGKLKY